MLIILFIEKTCHCIWDCLVISQVFEALQGKYAEYRKQLMITSSKLSQADMQRKTNRLTLFELEKLPEGTATFKAVGKMFISVPSVDIVQECKSLAEGTLPNLWWCPPLFLIFYFVDSVAESRLAEFTNQKASLEKVVQEVEVELRGILTAARTDAD
jgi:chaperonin cofactor prefoldin